MPQSAQLLLGICEWEGIVPAPLCGIRWLLGCCSLAICNLLEAGDRKPRILRVLEGNIRSRPAIDLPRSLYECCLGADSRWREHRDIVICTRGDNLITHNDGADRRPSMEDAGVSYAEEDIAQSRGMASLDND